jgi:hypothetical protein
VKFWIFYGVAGCNARVQNHRSNHARIAADLLRRFDIIQTVPMLVSTTGAASDGVGVKNKLTDTIAPRTVAIAGCR